MRDNADTATPGLEARLGHRFRDPYLLDLALTHTSYLNETAEPIDDNQRLEYLGDAIVDLLVAEVLYLQFPHAREGQLTRWRSQTVSTEALAGLARGLSLGGYLRLGRGEENTGGRDKDANLAAVVEALTAALYLDAGWEEMKRVMLPLFTPLIQRATAHRGPHDARSRLQEVVQARIGVTPRYLEVGEQGPDHDRRFSIQAVIGDEVWGEGTGHSKQAAAQAAAERALESRHLDGN